MRTNRRRLCLEHLSDLPKCLVTVDPSGLEFRRNGSVLLWTITCAGNANIWTASCNDLTLDLDIAESRGGFSSQLAVHIGLLGSSIFGFGEEMVPNFVSKRTCDH